MKKEDSGNAYIEDFLPRKGMGIHRAINKDTIYVPTSQITQEQFGDLLKMEIFKMPENDFYIGTKAGFFKRDKVGQWFALTNEDWALPNAQIYRPCLSPFIEDGKLQTRSEVIFIKDGK